VLECTSVNINKLLLADPANRVKCEGLSILLKAMIMTAMTMMILCYEGKWVGRLVDIREREKKRNLNCTQVEEDNLIKYREKRRFFSSTSCFSARWSKKRNENKMFGFDLNDPYIDGGNFISTCEHQSKV
jgi:hypothetical protein